jgi:predicted DNA-binding transcriptional regulator AlpA
MPVEISGKRFFSVTEVASISDVTRQTLWRWRKQGVIPKGRKYRGRKIVFTQDELETIYAYAHRLEPPAETTDFQHQLKLFDSQQTDPEEHS